MPNITFGWEFEFQDGPEAVMAAVSDSGCDCEGCNEDRGGPPGSGVLAPGLDLKEDGSVNGGEITTIGGHSREVCLELFRTVLRLGGWEVDEGCSFHIHVGDTTFGTRHDSMRGTRHTYQAEALTYLLLHWPRWPDAVKKRFLSDAREEYFRPTFNMDKFCAIRIHPQGTMEYRLWGNIVNSVEASIVLALTEEAHAHAMAVLSGKVGLWPPHMHEYFQGGNKGLEWLLEKRNILGERGFIWDTFYEAGKRWSARVQGKALEEAV